MEIKNVAITAAKKAGKILLNLSASKIRYKMKAKHDILAEGDIKSEKAIIDEIKRHFPTHGILSEEMGEYIKKSEYLWVIDPIDGTINFSRQIEEYCISIAVEHRGKLILGLIYQPALDNLYIAEKGKGAYLNGKRITVSDEKEVISMLLATDSSSKIDTRIRNYEILAKACKEVRHIRIFGSGALHLAKIAFGNIDIYYKTKANYWDYASGALLVKEAGGIVTDFQGNKFSRTSKGIVASNGKTHTKILKMLNR